MRSAHMTAYSQLLFHDRDGFCQRNADETHPDHETGGVETGRVESGDQRPFSTLGAMALLADGFAGWSALPRPFFTESRMDSPWLTRPEAISPGATQTPRSPRGRYVDRQ